MKKFLLYSFLALVILSCGKKVTVAATTKVTGQTIAYDPHPENSRLAQLHKKLTESESYQTAEKLADSLYACMPEGFENPEIIRDDEVFKEWLDKNLSLTKFKSYEHFSQLYSDMGDATVRDHDENAEFYDTWMNTDPDSWEFTYYAP